MHAFVYVYTLCILFMKLQLNSIQFISWYFSKFRYSLLVCVLVYFFFRHHRCYVVVIANILLMPNNFHSAKFFSYWTWNELIVFETFNRINFSNWTIENNTNKRENKNNNKDTENVHTHNPYGWGKSWLTLMAMQGIVILHIVLNAELKIKRHNKKRQKKQSHNHYFLVWFMFRKHQK